MNSYPWVMQQKSFPFKFIPKNVFSVKFNSLTDTVKLNENLSAIT